METLKKTKEKIAESVILNGIVGFAFEKPITFKSGIKSPIYCDFRKSIAFPHLRDLITHGFRQLLFEKRLLDADIIAGIAKGGVPHAAFLAKDLHKPMSYISVEAKDHGTKRLIDGAEVQDKKVVVIEDVVSMAGSIMKGIDIVQTEGAAFVVPCSVFSYDFQQSRDEFKKANLELHSLITVEDLLPMLQVKLSEEEMLILREWMIDPFGWSRQYA